MHVLLTNDDGYDAAGLRALREAFEPVADVTVVAPADDRSGVGAARSEAIEVEERDAGYAVHGTPADCVAFGLRGLEDPPGVVVSGCNHGPNFGAYIMTRSGTVGAAVEAAFLGVPAVAVSAYDRDDFFPPGDAVPDEFALPAELARDLTTRALSSDVFDAADFLNLNAPTTGDPDVRVTRPVGDYDTDVERGDDGVAFRDTFWADADSGDPPADLERERGTYPADSGREAVVHGDASVMPLTAPHAVADHPDLDDIADAVEP